MHPTGLQLAALVLVGAFAVFVLFGELSYRFHRRDDPHDALSQALRERDKPQLPALAPFALVHLMPWSALALKIAIAGFWLFILRRLVRYDYPWSQHMQTAVVAVGLVVYALLLVGMAL